jgi:hypothetical protein
VHQYQIARIGAPNSTPVHGKSGSPIGRQTLKKPSGAAARSAPQPPTASSPTRVTAIEPPIITNIWNMSE